MDILFSVEEAAERECDGAGFDAGHGYLIQKRLKLVIIVAVDDDDLVILVRESSCEGYACESGANDDDTRIIRFWQIDGHGCKYMGLGNRKEKARKRIKYYPGKANRD